MPTALVLNKLLSGTGYLRIPFAFPWSPRRRVISGNPPPLVGIDLVAKDKVDSFIAITADGQVIAFNGHVDLGTGVRTAFTQIVAEELDVELDNVTMVMGNTDQTPDQGPTTASASIQTSAIPMRRAAAQARHFLLQLATAELKVPVGQLSIEQGRVLHDGKDTGYSYATLLRGQKFELDLDTNVPLKDPRDYRIVGKSVPRLDIPAKVMGELTFVHDVRLPGMLHARVVRPPYAGRDSGALIGKSLESVDASSIAHLPGIVRLVVIGDFVAVVATREEWAIQAARRLKLKWKKWEPLADLSDLRSALRDNPDKQRPLKESGDVNSSLADLPRPLAASYIWPYQMHGSIGPSCGVADYKDGVLTIWTGSQNPHLLHFDLLKLLRIPARDIRLIRMEASGCYGRNCADDAAAEAALLALELKRPVRVQLMREEEHAWEPKGTAQMLEVRGGLSRKGNLVYDFVGRYPSNNAPLLALLHTGRSEEAVVEHKGDRTAVPQYRINDLRVVVRDMPTIVRAAWLRGVSALPNVFAHESFIDEVAALEQADQVEFRLRFMEEPRAIALLKAVAQRAGWKSQAPKPHAAPASLIDTDTNPHIRHGRGVAQHQYVHGSFPGTGSAWCAWTCDVDVDVATGEVFVRKVWVGYDCGQMINPAGVRHQIHGNVIQSISRVLKECVTFDQQGVVSKEWGSYPIMGFTELPEIDILIMPAEDHPPLGAGESASVPSAAAIANAIFNATGIRLRDVPFTPDRVRAALAALETQGGTGRPDC